MESAVNFFPDHAALEAMLKRFRDVRIAVLGDFFLDRYLVIDSSLDEPSLETGLTARQIVAVRNSPGAAGTVVNNLVALGAGVVHAVGAIGDDGYGLELRQALHRDGVQTAHLLAARGRFTPTYTKPMVRRNSGPEQELARLDLLNRTPTPSSVEDSLIAALEELLPRVDAVAVLDQVHIPGCGVLTARVRTALARLAGNFPRVWFLADSRSQINTFRGVCLKPNAAEALRAVGRESHSPAPTEVGAAAAALSNQSAKPVFVTMGALGMCVADGDSLTYVAGCPVDGPVDVVGAGDSATAGILLSLCSGASLGQAALTANLVASITVQQLGATGVARPDQVLARYREVAA